MQQYLLLLTLVAAPSALLVAAQYTINTQSACNYFKVQPATAAPASLKLDLTFYKKYVDATPLGGLWVLGSAVVSDVALLTAARQTAYFMRSRPDLQQLLVNANVKVMVLAPTEVTTQVPEYKYLAGGTTTGNRNWDSTRGLGATSYTLTTSGAEENLLCLGYPTDSYFSERIFPHEFGHTLSGSGDLPGTRYTVQGGNIVLSVALQNAYTAAITAGTYGTTYATTNSQEYWAEGKKTAVHVARLAASPLHHPYIHPPVLQVCKTSTT